MYRNLEAELKRKGITRAQIAEKRGKAWNQYSHNLLQIDKAAPHETT